MQEQVFRMLLVEDKADDADLLREAIAEEPSAKFELVPVARLSEAQERLEKEEFHAVLLDLGLPDSRGLDTLRGILAAAPDQPVVVLTALEDEELAVAAVRHGAQDYMVKGQVSSYMLKRSIRYAIERHRMRQALRALSLEDQLTGLYNRRGFLTFGKQHLKLAARRKRGVLVFMFDVDGFKKINDTFGHPEGDFALQEVAGVLKETFRESDIVARVGGDEFATLAIEAEEQNTQRIADRLQSRLDESNTRGDYKYALSVSMGTARFDPDTTDSLEELVAKADQVLYRNRGSRRTS